MKVKIGKYTSWFGPYQLAEKLMFWVPKEVDKYGFKHTAKRVHNFGEWLAHGSIEPEGKKGDIRALFDREDRKITVLYKFLLWVHKMRGDRTIKIQIDRWDTWSMDDTLALIILPMLKQLNETKHGSPWVEDEDVPEELRSTAAAPLTQEQKDCGHTDDNHEKRWQYVLDEMIFAFENKVDGDWEFKFTTGEYDYQSKIIDDEGTAQLIQGPNHTEKTDWEARKAYQRRISNGFRLFGKYYEALWD
jgi:hypothetical protein